MTSELTRSTDMRNVGVGPGAGTGGCCACVSASSAKSPATIQGANRVSDFHDAQPVYQPARKPALYVVLLVAAVLFAHRPRLPSSAARSSGELDDGSAVGVWPATAEPPGSGRTLGRRSAARPGGTAPPALQPNRRAKLPNLRLELLQALARLFNRDPRIWIERFRLGAQFFDACGLAAALGDARLQLGVSGRGTGSAVLDRGPIPRRRRSPAAFPRHPDG